MKRLFLFSFIGVLAYFLSGCYSFTGATIEGKTLNITPVINRAPSVVPTLVPTLTEKIRSRVLSQTGLAPVNSSEADYIIETIVQSYNVTIAGVSGNTGVSMNRLTITIQVDFKNKLDPKADFKQTFSRMRDFDGNVQLQTVENALIGQIAEELADDIFNKAFVNW